MDLIQEQGGLLRRAQLALANLPERLNEAASTYLEHLQTKVDLEATLHNRRAHLFLDGLQTGVIQGKNAETRDAELVLLLNGDKEYREAENGLRAVKVAATAAEYSLQNLRIEVGIYTTLISSLNTSL